MKTKKLSKLAKKLFRSSLTNGYLDNRKASVLLTVLAKEKPAGLTAILKLYKRLVENQIQKEQVVVETSTLPTNIAKFEKELAEKTKARKVIVKTNPDIIMGAKVTFGDWIIDATLDSKLKQLTAKL